MDYDPEVELSMRSMIVNLLYDLPLGGDFDLTFGAGIGTAWVELDPPLGESSQSVLSYQALAGLSYEISEGLQITATYRYTSFGDATDIAALLPSSVITFEDVSTSTLSLGVRVGF